MAELNAKVELVQGVGKKSNKPYTAVKVSLLTDKGEVFKEELLFLSHAEKLLLAKS